MKNIQFILIAICGLVVFGCSPSGKDYQGSEYMPDMGHSIAYEANYYDYYRYNRWGSEDDYHKMAQPRKPVQGTIPRGYAGAGPSLSKYAVVRGMNSLSAIAAPPNGSVPYYYEDTEPERTRAMNNIIENPFPITTAGLAEGKHLYDIFCGICHGSKGGGNGLIYDTDQNPLAKYPAAPANLISEEFVAATNGRYYHAIMHGKNVMGGYSDKISYEERWQVIHYIRSLQGKATKKEYTQLVNTLGGGGTPAGADYSNVLSLNANGGNVNIGAGGHGAVNHGGNHSGNHGDHMSHGTTSTTTTTTTGIMNLNSGGMQSGANGSMQGVQSTTKMKDGIAIPGAVESAKKKKGLKKFLRKTGDKIKDGGGKVKDGSKKLGGKLKGALKKKDTGNDSH